jgi:ribonuclease HI
MNKIDIYCDGSSRGNGQEVMRAGVVALLSSGDRMRAVGAYIGSATNQQAEIVAACVGLEALLRPCEVVLRSDSKYVVETMNGNFARRANHDFWSRLDLAASTHVVTWEWVKGRSGDRRQEACDKLARVISAMGEARDELLVEAVHRLRGENTPALVRAVTDALKYLAGACDGARKRGDHGFDEGVGWVDAMRPSVRPRPGGGRCHGESRPSCSRGVWSYNFVPGAEIDQVRSG